MMTRLKVKSSKYYYPPCSNRIPEAALMARSYLPSKVSEIVAIWRNDLNQVRLLQTRLLKFLILKSLDYITETFAG